VNINDFESAACRRSRWLMDWSVSKEIARHERVDVLRHTPVCVRCALAEHARLRERARLVLVSGEAVPPEPRARIRRMVRAVSGCDLPLDVLAIVAPGVMVPVTLVGKW
jgi:hypothetical protein